VPLQSYAEVVDSLRKKKRQKHLLLGNGFSMAYDAKIFSYNALNSFIERLDNDILSRLFAIVNSKNFEAIMQQLETLKELARAFGADAAFLKRIENASKELRDSFLEALKELHPEHVFTVPEAKSRACAAFLKEYLSNEGLVFTTNYDILLYWVLMRNKVENAIDGFGREVESEGDFVPDEDLQFSELQWGKHKDEQTIFYVHGALPLFDTGVEIVKEVYSQDSYLLENIKKRIEKKEYPVFVTAGTGKDKLTHIMHNRYLSHCYERLSAIEGSLVTFGFNFGEYDSHIIEAINAAAKHGRKAGDKLHSVYIGVYSDASTKHISAIKDRFKCKVNLFDSKTASVWSSSQKQ
jgi:hypothetical protein